VGQVTLVGLARREIQVRVNREKLRAFGLTYAQVADALQREPGHCQEAGAGPAGATGEWRQVPLRRSFQNLIVAVLNGKAVFTFGWPESWTEWRNGVAPRSSTIADTVDGRGQAVGREHRRGG
jgi:hypothetical protein